MTPPSCPTCQRRPADPAYRPFCSRRCADIDLHRWMAGRYVIPGGAPDASEDAPSSAPHPNDRDET